MRYIITIRPELLRSTETADITGVPREQLDVMILNGKQNESLTWSPADIRGYIGTYEADNEVLAISKAAKANDLEPNLLEVADALPENNMPFFKVSVKILRTILHPETNQVTHCVEEWESGMVRAQTPEKAREKAKLHYKNSNTKTMTHEILDSNVYPVAKAKGCFLNFVLE